MTPTDLLPEFRALFPEFNAESDAKVETYLNIALITFNKCHQAVLYLAAHNLVMANSAGIGNSSTVPSTGNNQSSLALKSASVDGKSASFAMSTKGKDAQFTTTSYGLLFLQLKKACGYYALSVGVSGGNTFNYW
jgi:hypothetical protein